MPAGLLTRFMEKTWYGTEIRGERSRIGGLSRVPTMVGGKEARKRRVESCNIPSPKVKKLAPGKGTSMPDQVPPQVISLTFTANEAG